MQPIHMKRVLVLDANQRSTLAVVRSLGKHGVTLITADESSSALAGRSRYSADYFIHPSALTESEVFIQFVSDLCQREYIDIIIPMTELTTSLLLSHKTALGDIHLPFPDIETVDSLADKSSLMRLAQNIDIPLPQTWYVEKPGQIPVDLSTMVYPLVLKPGKSWLYQDGGWIHTAVKIASDAISAENILKTDPAFKYSPFMLQEYIPGSGGGLFAIYDHGKPLAFFAHRRLREKPPRGGVSVLSESAPLDDRLKSQATKLLNHVHWHGVAMVEFRITPEGEAYLMEINTRFWGSLQLAVDSGVDFPWLLYQMCCQQPVATVDSYKVGKRLRWSLGNLDWLYLILRDSSYSKREKLQAIFAFLTPSPFKTRLEVLRLSDIKPFIWELRQYIRNLRK